MAVPQPDISGRALAAQLLDTAQSATLAAEAAATAAVEAPASLAAQNSPGGLLRPPVPQARP